MVPIDKNVPLPNRSGGAPHVYPWQEMEVGDSFLFSPGVVHKNASSHASTSGKRYGRKFATRTTPEGIRCWRIA